MDVLELRCIQPSTLTILLLVRIIILFHIDLLLVFGNVGHVGHMTKFTTFVRLRNSTDRWSLVDLDIGLARGIIPVIRIAPSNALVVVVEIEVFVRLVQTPGNVTGAVTPGKEPLVVPSASASIRVAVLAGEEFVGVLVVNARVWTVIRDDRACDGEAGQEEEDGCNLHDGDLEGRVLLCGNACYD
jgi:hypothetical protein